MKERADSGNLTPRELKPSASATNSVQLSYSERRQQYKEEIARKGVAASVTAITMEGDATYGEMNLSKTTDNSRIEDSR